MYPTALTNLSIPRPASNVNPPAAARESVHPANGCFKDEAIIAGLNRHTVRSPLFFRRDFSAKFLVKV